MRYSPSVMLLPSDQSPDRLRIGMGMQRQAMHLSPSSLHPVRISQAHWDELIAHARVDAPNECCGYLSAKDGVVEAVFRAENPRGSPYGYELDHKSLFAANELDDEGFEVGIYHSHPRSPAEPSQTDINLATYPHWRYLIISLEAEPVVRVWRIADGRVEEEALDVVDA
jgi:proteasome lid subunit RPN8/RPN11